MAPPAEFLDLDRMRQALDLAQMSIGLSDPNPRVGCVIGRANGMVLGIGHTQMAGEAHAEVMAIRDARSHGQDVRGATAWVTLEPCAHHGRTPPCCDALIDAGIARVVVAMVDPYHQVQGRGIQRLRAAGIEVELLEGEVSEHARDLNIGFVSRQQRGRPWVRVKTAISMDGRTALNNGASQWITGEEARADGHRWRQRAGAILTGVGTVLHDDPRLDVRAVSTKLHPLRVVLDSAWRTPLAARVLQPPGRALVVGSADVVCESRHTLSTLAELLPVRRLDGGVALQDVFSSLTDRGVNEVHVEAGATLNASLLRGGWVDEWLVYLAPRWLGAGRDAVALPELQKLPGRPDWRFTEAVQVGADLRIRMRQSLSDHRV